MTTRYIDLTELQTILSKLGWYEFSPNPSTYRLYQNGERTVEVRRNDTIIRLRMSTIGGDALLKISDNKILEYDDTNHILIINKYLAWALA